MEKEKIDLFYFTLQIPELMKYIIIDDNQNFAKAHWEQLLKEADEESNSKTCNEDILQFKQGDETITIDYTKHNVAQIADAIIQSYSNEENKLSDDIVLFINVNLKTQNGNRQDLKGIELLTWLRVKNIMNHVILYSFESLHMILQRDKKALIAISDGTTYLRLPIDFKALKLEGLKDKIARKENLQTFLKESYIETLNHIEKNGFFITHVWQNIIDSNKEVTNDNINAEVAKYISDDIADKTKDDIKDIVTKIKKFGVKDLKISLALCDDYADAPIGSSTKTKKNIVEETINGLCPELKEVFVVNPFSSIDALLETTENSKCCDIILLDFDLGKDSYGGNIRGTKYFEERKDKKDPKDQKFKHQFLDKNWVLPISYLSSEMIKDFRDKKVTFTQNDLVLSMGADPITKPYLFLFELLTIVKEQLDLALSWSVDFENGYKKKAKDLIEEINSLQK